MKSISGTIMMFLIIVLAGCKNPPPAEEKDNVEVNVSFAANPPVADQLFIEKIKDNNNEVLVIAHFVAGQMKDTLFALDNDGEKVVLRDDGKKGDKQAGDGMFTTKVSLTENEVSSLLEDQQNLFKKNNGRIEVFEGRTLVTRTLPEKLANKDAFKRHVPIDIRFFRPCVLPGFDTIKVQENCLLINNLAVVQDPTRTFNVTAPVGLRGNPNGVWTFWELMRQLASKDPATIANDDQTAEFIMAWLAFWKTPQTVNGEIVPARTNITPNIITQWLSPVSGKIVPDRTPFRLTAIVNRVDLRDNAGYGGKNAGEGRFVFCATNSGGFALPFTVIFEYGINKKGCRTIKDYAKQWYDLKDLAIGLAPYNTALENITRQFTQCGTNTGNVNQSSLNQLRTNENSLNPVWELREFNLKATLPAATLDQVTTKREPALIFNAKLNNADVQRLAEWVNANTPGYLLHKDNGINIPDFFPATTIPFLGGHGITRFPPTGAVPVAHHWDADPVPGSAAHITNDFARHYFSLNTCSGCHGGETQTFFTHVNQARFNQVAGLSDFLTGDDMPVTDGANRPSGSPNTFTFSDLKRRAIDLNKLALCPCGKFSGLSTLLLFKPIRSVH